MTLLADSPVRGPIVVRVLIRPTGIYQIRIKRKPFLDHLSRV